MKTLLPGERANKKKKKKKFIAGGRGVRGRRNEDFITGRERKKITAGARGWLCGRKCEDFVTGRWPRSRNITSQTYHPPPRRAKLESTRHPLPLKK